MSDKLVPHRTGKQILRDDTANKLMARKTDEMARKTDEMSKELGQQNKDNGVFLRMILERVNKNR